MDIIPQIATASAARFRRRSMSRGQHLMQGVPGGSVCRDADPADSGDPSRRDRRLPRAPRGLLSIPEPAGTPRRDDEIDVPAAALRAAEPRRPIRYRQIGAVPLGLLARVEVDLVPAILAPDAQQEVRPGRAAERRRSRFAFVAVSSHIREMQPDLSPEDYAAIAALLREEIAADRFPLSPRVKRMRAILDKLEPPRPRPAPPPLRPAGEPSMVLAKMRGGQRRR